MILYDFHWGDWISEYDVRFARHSRIGVFKQLTSLIQGQRRYFHRKRAHRSNMYVFAMAVIFNNTERNVGKTRNLLTSLWTEYYLPHHIQMVHWLIFMFLWIVWEAFSTNTLVLLIELSNLVDGQQTSKWKQTLKTICFDRSPLWWPWSRRLMGQEYHGWESATWASLCQTAGDLVAAIAIKLLAAYGHCAFFFFFPGEVGVLLDFAILKVRW